MNEKDSAVSPVVGVMMMIVVTVIVAAVVSSFTSGVIANVEPSSGAQVEFVGVSDSYSVNYTYNSRGRYSYVAQGPIGFVFKVNGGDLDLRNLRMNIQGLAWGVAGAATLTYNDDVSLAYLFGEGSQSTRSGASTADGTVSMIFPDLTADNHPRMVKYGEGLEDEDKFDPIVHSGEMFLVYVEYLTPAGQIGLRADRGTTNTTTWASGAIGMDQVGFYDLADMNSGVTYASGMLGMDDFI